MASTSHAAEEDVRKKGYLLKVKVNLLYMHIGLLYKEGLRAVLLKTTLAAPTHKQ